MDKFTGVVEAGIAGIIGVLMLLAGLEWVYKRLNRNFRRKGRATALLTVWSERHNRLNNYFTERFWSRKGPVLAFDWSKVSAKSRDEYNHITGAIDLIAWKLEASSVFIEKAMKLLDQGYLFNGKPLVQMLDFLQYDTLHLSSIRVPTKLFNPNARSEFGVHDRIIDHLMVDMECILPKWEEFLKICEAAKTSPTDALPEAPYFELAKKLKEHNIPADIWLKEHPFHPPDQRFRYLGEFEELRTIDPLAYNDRVRAHRNLEGCLAEDMSEIITATNDVRRAKQNVHTLFNEHQAACKNRNYDLEGALVLADAMEYEFEYLLNNGGSKNKKNMTDLFELLASAERAVKYYGQVGIEVGNSTDRMLLNVISAKKREHLTEISEKIAQLERTKPQELERRLLVAAKHCLSEVDLDLTTLDTNLKDNDYPTARQIQNQVEENLNNIKELFHWFENVRTMLQKKDEEKAPPSDIPYDRGVRTSV